MVIVKWAILAVIGLYLVALLAVYFAQRGFMYFPPEEVVPSWFLDEYDEQILPISVAGIGEIKSIYSPPPEEGAPVILFIHGNGSAAYQYTDHFAAFKAWGVGYLAVEFPGYAGNPGVPNETNILRTSLANYDRLIDKGIQPGNIVIYGDSLGAACAVHVASERQSAGL